MLHLTKSSSANQEERDRGRLINQSDETNSDATADEESPQDLETLIGFAYFFYQKSNVNTKSLCFVKL